MQVISSQFIKGVIGDTYEIGGGFPQVAFFGRSNVGKSSVLNTIIERKDLARSSSKPGKTTEANFYLINNSLYFIDFPGYGYAQMSKDDRDTLAKRILWYIEESVVKPRVSVLVVDAKVGLTKQDKAMLKTLKNSGHNVVVLANKVDKLKKNDVRKSIFKLGESLEAMGVGRNELVAFSSKEKLGKDELLDLIGDAVLAV